MLGWHISVYRLDESGPQSGLSPDRAASEGFKIGALLAATRLGKRIAVWQTGLGGTDWLESLVEEGKALRFLGSGYPDYYFAPAQHLLSRIRAGPPGAHGSWICGPEDIITSAWEGRTTIDDSAAGACTPDEWLLVEVWDES